MQGFFHRLLRVDLSSRQSFVQDLPEALISRGLGGKGLAVQLLLKHAPPGVDPLAREAPLLIVLGPASGTVLAPASRYGLFAKSPLTRVFGESYSGGHVAPQISAAGFDAILLTGAAETPLFLEISDGGVTFHDATRYWGMDLYAAEKALLSAVAVRRARAIAIGPAGERQIPFAVVGNDQGHQSGRTGMGAVMGSKGLKGIVFHGKAERPVYDAEAVRSYNEELRERGLQDAGVEAYRQVGTPMLVSIANTAGSFPSYYWSAGRVPHWEAINAEAIEERLTPRPRACYRCFIGCRKMATVAGGPHEGLTLEGPEYETINAFGGVCGVEEPEEILFLNGVCDRLGIDTITAGNVVGFAIEAGRRDVLDLELEYGDAEGIAELLRRIVNREGSGELLAQGVRAASEELGLEELAVHVKGLEPPGYDPRALKGMGLAYAVSDRGACHLRATVYKAEFSGWVDRNAVDGKADVVLDFEDRHTVFDTLIFCRFYRDLIGWEDLPRVIQALTGLEMDKEELRALSARIANDIRAYNLREGMEAADDTLPRRLLEEPLKPSGERLTRTELDAMVDDYYALRGWAR